MISDKQKQILAFPYTSYYALICYGAVRSGKTSIMSWAFVDWAMRRFDKQRFGICGKTVESTKKNIIEPLLGMGIFKRMGYTMTWRSDEKTLEVKCGRKRNIFEVFGGKDDASYRLIQGRTLAGVFLDEVALMPRSFVEQALARCSVDGAKFWFSCNPESPAHWFYQEWILKADQHKALCLHFLMTDNPALSEETLARYDSMYPDGVFRRRYILGEWCMAEGLVYNFDEANIIDFRRRDEYTYGVQYYISCDYGTQNPFAAILWRVCDSVAVAVEEYYYSGRDSQVQMTDEDYCDAVVALAGQLDIEAVIVDPSAASFIAALRRRDKFPVRKAKNDVGDGIRCVSVLLRKGRIKINRCCKNIIREFGLYRWNEKAADDAVVKENDHAMDALRYMAYTVLRYRYRDDTPSSEKGLQLYL